MDLAKKPLELANEILPAGTPLKQTLLFIEKVSFALEAAYNAGKKDGLKEGKAYEKERSSRHGAASHRDSCYDEDCLGQCTVR